MVPRRIAGFARSLALVLVACTSAPPESTSTNEPPWVVEQATISAPDRWLDLDVSDDSGCVVEHDGRLWCWGYLPEWSKIRSPPTAMGVNDARAVSLSSHYVCWIDGDRHVRCRGRVGSWSVEGVREAVDVMVDDFRGCALELDGELRCWEDDKPAELVHSDVVLADFVLHGGCALERSGAVACWTQAVQHKQPRSALEHITATPGIVHLEVVDDRYGGAAYILDDRGRLRRYRFGNINETGEWETLGEVAGAVEVAVARDHLCVRKLDGTAVCRGRNSHGQLGDGTSIRREDFVEIQAREVLGLALGDLQTCVRTRTDIACSGWGPPPSALQQHTLENLVAVSLAAHGATTCAVDRDDDLYCWGSAAFDSFAHGPSLGVHSATTPALATNGVGALRGIRARDNQVMWVDADGQPRRALGADESAGRLVPFDPSNLPRPKSTIVQLAAGYALCAVEQSTGPNIITCGIDDHYPRGPMPGVTDPLAIAVGLRTVCAIDGRKRVACGVYPDLYEDMFDHRMTAVPNLERAQAIAVSDGAACALLDDGRVRCWTNHMVETVSEKHERLRNEPGPVYDVGLSNIAALAASESDYCTVDHAGTVGCWRPNEGSTDPLPGPQIDAPVVELVAGAEHHCARDREGRVTCWGDESHGQLGRIPPQVALTPRRLEIGPSE
jgi:alpha-tubulin suppressor-like RCC1 family protein